MRRLAARPTAQCAGAASFWCSDYRCVHQCYPSSTTCTLAPHLWHRSLAPPCCHLWCCHPRLQTTHTTTTNATAYQVWINAGLILPVVVTALFSILRRARAGLGEAEGQDSGHLGGSCAPSFPSPSRPRGRGRELRARLVRARKKGRNSGQVLTIPFLSDVKYI